MRTAYTVIHRYTCSKHNYTHEKNEWKKEKKWRTKENSNLHFRKYLTMAALNYAKQSIVNQDNSSVSSLHLTHNLPFPRSFCDSPFEFGESCLILVNIKNLGRLGHVMIQSAQLAGWQAHSGLLCEISVHIRAEDCLWVLLKQVKKEVLFWCGSVIYQSVDFIG